MLIVLIGKTASGKDTVAKELIKMGFEKITTTTTRPMRDGEIPGVTYNYTTNDDFEKKIEEGFFLEYKSYLVADGSKWYYGSPMEAFTSIKDTDKKLIILTPDGYRDFLKRVSIQYKAFYIYAKNDVIKKRLLKRGDDKDEAERRLKQDNADFSGVEWEVDRIVYNNGDKTPNEVAKLILRYI